MLPRILIVDDESSICISLSLALEPEYEVVWETDPIRALDRLQTEPIDLVLLDMVIGPYDGLDILMKIKKLAPLAAVIMMTAYGSIRSSVSAMTRGAFTYLTKPLDLEELKIYIRQALEFRSLNENVTYLNDQLEAQNQAEELIGTSPALEQVRTMLRKFQNVDVNVLITGESGTGKRIAAHTLHNGADGRRFVTVNCAAFDEKRLEEEFFGYKMDAVPGALCDRRGKLDYANGGTLYLDGIGDMPPEFQRKLLRVLQEHTFSPIGSREVHQFHTRIIASANRTSDELVQSGLLRQDLLYRLNAVEIHMPRLRERRADIPLLCSHFISRSSTLRNKRVRIRGVTEKRWKFSAPTPSPAMSVSLPTQSNMPASSQAANGFDRRTFPISSQTRVRDSARSSACLPERHCRSSNGLPSRPLTAQTPESAARWSPSSASARAGFGTS